MIEFLFVIGSVILYAIFLLVFFGKEFFNVHFDENDIFDESVFYKDLEDEPKKGEKK